ncbi:MAG: hypothetical protein AABX24_01670 [Nanoarchaeota archaeon]
MGKILTFTGASGSGKSSIAKSLGFSLVLSTTTRAPRPSDLPGEYEYIDSKYFDSKSFDSVEARNDFLWIKEYGGNYYSTRYDSINLALSRPENFIMIIVPEVLPMLLDYAGKEKVLPFYIRSPDEAVLRSRLETRGELEDSIERRLKGSRDWDLQAEGSGIHYIFITNNGAIEEAVGQVRKYLRSVLNCEW